MWFKKAAEGGDDDAQTRLAEAYENGKLDLATDEEEALKWFKKAAEGGNYSAQDRLGWAYEQGELGLVIDMEKAQKWYQKYNEARRGGGR